MLACCEMDAVGRPGGSRDRTATTRRQDARASWVDESRALVTDLAEWLELRVTHLQLQVQTRVERTLAAFVVRFTIAGLAIGAMLFGLAAVALVVGRWTGFPSAGFLLVALLLSVAALGVWLFRHRLALREPTAEVTVASSEAASDRQPVTPSPSRSELATPRVERDAAARRLEAPGKTTP